MALSRNGVLVCLCSRNNEADVFEVFDRRADMVVRREHLAAWRINWQDKADNLIALSEALNVGLDSFVFVDDDPLVCDGVRTRCPEVVTIERPAAAQLDPFHAANRNLPWQVGRPTRCD